MRLAFKMHTATNSARQRFRIGVSGWVDEGVIVEDHATYLIANVRVSGADSHLQQILARAYVDPIRPRCLCVPNGVEMYIAKYGHFMLKRMPGTGKDHAAACESYEPDPQASGLGFHLGETVLAKGPDQLEVRAAFALDRFDGRPIERGEPSEETSVSANRRALSILGLLHLVWDQAEFNRWTPAMTGKRHQGVIRKYLLEAAEKIELKGMRLSERLFVPEQFKAEDVNAIKSRREQAFAVMTMEGPSTKHRLMMLIGEIKSIEKITLGYKLLIKHMPDCPLMLDAKSGGKILKKFEPLFSLRDMHEGVRLVAVLTIAMKGFADYRVDTMSIAMTTDTWIPIEDSFEKALADALVAARRRFIKPLRFDAPSSVTFPNFLLMDAALEPVSLNIVVPTANKTAQKAKHDLITGSPPGSWVWRVEESPQLPALPPKLASADAASDRKGARIGTTPAKTTARNPVAPPPQSP